MRLSVFKRYRTICFFFCLLFIYPSFLASAQQSSNDHSEGSISAEWIRENVVKNPVTRSWMEDNLKGNGPHLMLTEETEARLRSQLKETGPINSYYQYIRGYADQILDKPLLEREQVGRRLLGVSREAVRRSGTLALVYRITKEEKYLDRLAEELDAVSSFSDWNPSHFLDVAEMSYAVAIGLDWAGPWLPEETVRNAKSALKQHLQISFEDKDYNWWINSDHNWNQVCHAGLSAAAIVLADEEPELATQTIHRAVEKLPLALAAYSPDGAYPEGPTYWDYGTSYNLLALSFYESAFGTDFNLSQSPGFMESAVYRMVVVAPSGQSFNYGDAGYGDLDLATRGNLSWFAQKTGNTFYLDKSKFHSLAEEALNSGASPSRLSHAYLLWLTQFDPKTSNSLPVYWKGDGHNPVAILRSEPEEQTGFYLGAKGGSASVNHGNMDAGSFIFELNGVRWSVDPGNQSYNQLEQILGGALWDQSQDSRRWTLLTKGNQFHSTLTVNGQRHNADGYAPITDFRVDQNPKEITIELTDVFKDQLKQAVRSFKKTDEQTLRVEDEVTLNDDTVNITWSMITQAHVKTLEKGAILTQNSQELHLNILQPEGLSTSIISLDPPPLSYDKRIPGLKKIEVNLPAYLVEDYKARIVIELTVPE